MRSRSWGLIALVLLVIAAALLGAAQIWRREPKPSVSPTPTISVTPGLTPSPSPTHLPLTPSSVQAEPLTYTVQPGDTLYGIAQAHDIAIELLVTANDLADPNLLQVGQILIIPQGESPDPMAHSPGQTPDGTSSAGDRNYLHLPTLTPSGPPVIEITRALDPANLEAETIVLQNSGGAVSLEGWKLSTAADDTFVFPALTLFSGAVVRVHSAEGDDSPRDLYWDRTEPAWEGGKLVTLRDAGGIVVDTHLVPAP